MKNETIFSKDAANKTIHVSHEFSAPVGKVWEAWTDSSILDKWWAPKPWRAETKSMNFTEGGQWFYCMVGPNDERHWNRVDFKTIKPGQSFSAEDGFCDENGNFSADMPILYWLNEFKASETGTRLEATITFDSEAGLEKIIETGFQEGFTMGLGNLDELLRS